MSRVWLFVALAALVVLALHEVDARGGGRNRGGRHGGGGGWWRPRCHHLPLKECRDRDYDSWEWDWDSWFWSSEEDDEPEVRCNKTACQVPEDCPLHMTCLPDCAYPNGTILGSCRLIPCAKTTDYEIEDEAGVKSDHELVETFLTSCPGGAKCTAATTCEKGPCMNVTMSYCQPASGAPSCTPGCHDHHGGSHEGPWRW